jgi:hypothetical protein
MASWIHNPASTGALQEYRQASFKACKNADKLRNLREPSGRRLANFVRPRASLPRTTKNKPAHRSTPIINGKKIFSRTPKCYLRWSWARDPEDSKNDPMVQVRERRADGEPSLVVGRGHVSGLMLGLIALTRQKQLAKSRQAASEVAPCPLLPWYCVKLSWNICFRDFQDVFYLEKVIFRLGKDYFTLVSPSI